MFKTKLVIIALFAASLSACGPTPTYAPAPQVDSTQVQEAPAQAQGYSGGTLAAGALGGAALGYMMGKHNGRKENTVVVHQAPSYYGRSYGYAPRRTITTTTTRRGFGGRTTVTRTITRHR